MTRDDLYDDEVLRGAAELALHAPSIFNTQPWRWQIRRGTLTLWADHSRQLLVADPNSRLLTISCGVALHHARVALAAAGREVRVHRLPDLLDSDRIADLALTGRHTPTSGELEQAGAIRLRHTDRRPFTAEPVDAGVIDSLRAVAHAQGPELHVVGRDQLARLALAGVQATAAQLAEPGYRVELMDWTHRPQWSDDGMPLATAVAAVPRHVPVRELAPYGGASRPTGGHTDLGTLHALVFTPGDGEHDWLHAGEALSAVLLTAVAQGLGTAPMSDVTEVPATREQLRALSAGGGYPQIGVRIGHPPAGRVPLAPRRFPDDVIFS